MKAAAKREEDKKTCFQCGKPIEKRGRWYRICSEECWAAYSAPAKRILEREKRLGRR